MIGNPVIRVSSSPISKYSAGIGYIIIPSNVERDLYIKNCFRTNSISILCEDGQFIQDVSIDKFKLQLIDFPQNKEEIGSSLVWVNIAVQNKPIIIGVINKGDETDILNEGEFRLFKESKNASVFISGNGEKGNLFINVESFTSSGGILDVKVTNNSKNAKVNLEIEGDINVFGKNLNLNFEEALNFLSQGEDSVIQMKTSKGLTLKVKNSSGEGGIGIDEDGNMTIEAEDTLIISGGTNGGVVKALELKTQSNLDKDVLDTLLNIINGAPIAEPGNGAPSAFQIALAAALVGKSTGTWDNLENDKFKH